MAEHFTKLTIQATYWCKKCGGARMHRVDGGRRGPCLTCMAKPLPLQPPRIEQGNLFK